MRRLQAIAGEHLDAGAGEDLVGAWDRGTRQAQGTRSAQLRVAFRPDRRARPVSPGLVTLPTEKDAQPGGVVRGYVLLLKNALTSREGGQVAARKRADPRYNVEHYRIKASQAALKKNPRIVGELMKELVAEVRRQAEKRGLVVTEGLSEDKRELELTIDPLALVQQRARERQDREHREERRKRERDALEKARGAIATPGGRDTTSW